MTFPVEHFSARSLHLASTCLEKWRRRYVLGEKEPLVSAVLVGSAFHSAYQQFYLDWFHSWSMPTGEEVEKNFRALFQIAKEEAEVQVYWVNSEEDEIARGIEAVKVYYPYACEIRPLKIEEKFELWVPGVPVPVIGYIDVEEERGIRDTKTSTRPVGLKAEWRMQDRIYKLATRKDFFWDVVVSNKTQAYVVTCRQNHKLVSLYTEREANMTEKLINMIYRKVQYCLDHIGPDHPWEGAISQPKACSECGYRKICPWWDV